MAEIKRLDYYLGALPFGNFYVDDCDTLKNFIDSLLDGKPSTMNNTPLTGNVNVTNQSVTILDDLDSIATLTPEYVYDNYFSNDTSTEKTYQTLSFEKDVQTTVSTTVTHGFQIGGKLGAEVKGSVSIPFVADGGVTVSAEISGQYNFSSADTETTTTSQKLIIPSQSGNIRPGYTTRVQIMLAKINIPQTAVHFSGSMSGTVHRDPIPSSVIGLVDYDLYDEVRSLENNCSNSTVGRDTGLVLNNANQSVDFSGSGFFTGSITAFNFYVKITEYPINNSSQENIRWYSIEPKVLNQSIIRHRFPSNSSVNTCNC
nr:epsilon-toxin family protein [Bacillus thuringiensis]